MRNSNLSAEKSEKRDPLGFFNIRSVAKYQANWWENPLKTLKKFRKKVSQSRKGVGVSVPKSENLLLRNTCKKLVHTHGLEHEPSGLKSKHLTTRPRTPGLCDLRAETRELSSGKKHPHFPITLAHRKCKKVNLIEFLQYLQLNCAIFP